MCSIYILELEQNKYYIGKSNNIELRINSHFINNGSEWTQIYKPIKVIDIINNCDDYDEDKYVFKYMNLYGIDNVRGGSFSKLEICNEYKLVIQHILYSTNNLCYVCKEFGHFGKNCSKKIITNNIQITNITNPIICTRCKRYNHIKENCNYKTFKGGKKIKGYKYINKLKNVNIN